jgi:hypothetical protein
VWTHSGGGSQGRVGLIESGHLSHQIFAPPSLPRSDAPQRFISSLQKKNTGQRWAISLIQKALDVAWDMWEQQNDINNNTLHPRHAAEVLEIKAQLQSLYQTGSAGLLPQDNLLFFKQEANTLLKGLPTEMLQWISSVLLASRRAALA